ncbi:MAG: EAL domain-containing protein, partial [Actinobacteria bacterium]|nr:EAL domain-containing protein [Actinomycetota bacterium]
LNRLNALGVRLSVDDFGTGYSSLSYLKRLPVHEMKIDRSFVLSMSRDGSDTAIVRSIVDLGENLGLHVVAEGVEDADTWERLREFGCGAAQGYHMSRPLPAAQFRTWLDNHPHGHDAAGKTQAGVRRLRPA